MEIKKTKEYFVFIFVTYNIRVLTPIRQLYSLFNKIYRCYNKLSKHKQNSAFLLLLIRYFFNFLEFYHCVCYNITNL